MTILSPVPDGAVEAAGAPRQWTLPERIRLGLLSNGKPNTSNLLEGLLEVVEADSRIAMAGSLRKESASRPAAADVLARLRTGVDLVVGATAD
jgi:hypothetical protein